MPGAHPEVLPPASELGIAQKLRVAGEISRTCIQVRWLMRRKRLPEVVDTLRAGCVDEHDPEVAYAIGRRLGRPVLRTLTPLPGDSRCLTRSLVLVGMLARRGVVGDLLIGVNPGDEFGAHAWVEHHGRKLTPSERSNPLVKL